MDLKSLSNEELLDLYMDNHEFIDYLEGLKEAEVSARYPFHPY